MARGKTRQMGIYLLRALCMSFIFTILCLPASSVSLPSLILAVPMRQCCGQHWRMGSTFPTAILNGTCFFLVSMIHFFLTLFLFV